MFIQWLFFFLDPIFASSFLMFQIHQIQLFQRTRCASSCVMDSPLVIDLQIPHLRLDNSIFTFK